MSGDKEVATAKPTRSQVQNGLAPAPPQLFGPTASASSSKKTTGQAPPTQAANGKKQPQKDAVSQQTAQENAQKFSASQQDDASAQSGDDGDEKKGADDASTQVGRNATAPVEKYANIVQKEELMKKKAEKRCLIAKKMLESAPGVDDNIPIKTKVAITELSHALMDLDLTDPVVVQIVLNWANIITAVNDNVDIAANAQVATEMKKIVNTAIKSEAEYVPAPQTMMQSIVSRAVISPDETQSTIRLKWNDETNQVTRSVVKSSPEEARQAMATNASSTLNGHAEPGQCVFSNAQHTKKRKEMKHKHIPAGADFVREIVIREVGPSEDKQHEYCVKKVTKMAVKRLGEQITEGDCSRIMNLSMKDIVHRGGDGNITKYTTGNVAPAPINTLKRHIKEAADWAIDQYELNDLEDMSETLLAPLKTALTQLVAKSTIEAIGSFVNTVMTENQIRRIVVKYELASRVQGHKLNKFYGDDQKKVVRAKFAKFVPGPRL